MSYFLWGTIILLSASAIFYSAFVLMIYYWHEKKITVLIVPFLYAFDFFVISFLIIFPIAFLLEYFPEILKFLETY